MKKTKNLSWRHRCLAILLVLAAGIILAACLPPPASPAVPPSASPFGPDTDPLPPAQDTAPVQNTFIPPTGALPSATATSTVFIPTVTNTAVPPVRFAVIGDYGLAGKAEEDVANLVKSWQPDFIITTGDNNYPQGEQATIDRNIGQYYHEYISPYTGDYGEGSDINRFFPSLGNHDWYSPGAQPYLDYFELPGNERYYDFTWGPVHFFALDNLADEPDGIRSDSAQAEWLREKMQASTARWQVVYMHVPPYSSGLHGSNPYMQAWPFNDWGADAVLAGHDHTYERLDIGGVPYFVNGVGGGAIYSFENIEPASQARYNDDYGAMLVVAGPDTMTFQFINRQGEVIDSISVP